MTDDSADGGAGNNTRGNNTSPQLPTSNALIEAKPRESLAELMSRDPEGYSDQDLDVIVATLREQRQRWEAAEALGKKPAVKKAPTMIAPGALLSMKPGDIGL